jgi:hypothetical protein
MISTNDLVEDWIQVRTILQRQLKQLEPGPAQAGNEAPDSRTKATAARVKTCIDELNALLKDYATAPRT